jgi:hypothetical protein
VEEDLKRLSRGVEKVRESMILPWTVDIYIEVVIENWRYQGETKDCINPEAGVSPLPYAKQHGCPYRATTRALPAPPITRRSIAKTYRPEEADAANYGSVDLSLAHQARSPTPDLEDARVKVVAFSLPPIYSQIELQVCGRDMYFA